MLLKKRLFIIICVLLLCIVLVVLSNSKPKITKDSVIKGFISSKDYFISITDYALKVEDDFYITYENLEEKAVGDEKFNTAVKYLIKKAGYKKILKSRGTDGNTSIIFVRGGNHHGANGDEYGVAYTLGKNNSFGTETEELGKGGYFYFIGYT